MRNKLKEKIGSVGLVLMLAAALCGFFAPTLIDLTGQIKGILPAANGGTAVNSTATFPSSGTVMVTTTNVACSQVPALTGDVTRTAGTCTTAIAPGVVANADLAAQAYRTIMDTFCTGGSMAASSTVFMPGYGGVLTTCTGLGTTRTSGTKVQAGTIKNLNVNLGTGGKSGDAVTVEIAGVASALTCSYGTTTSCSDTTHSAAVTAGQVITIKVVTGASDTSANINVTFELWN